MRAKRESRGPGAEVERTRLLRRLRHASTYRVAAIVAPGGYGKSTLVRQFLAGDPRRHVYVRFRPGDAELDDAARRLCEAVTMAAPHASTNLAAAVRAVPLGPGRGPELARWLLRHLHDDGWLIALDDLHNADRPDTVAFLAALAGTETSNQWLLVSRGDLGLPFALWRASGQMDEPLRTEDLKFDLDELDAFGDLIGAALEHSELEAILTRTNAWPMAAAFAVRTADRRQTLPQTLGATQELVFDFFAQDAFATLTFEQRDLVVAAAELPELDVTILEAAGYRSARWTFSVLAQRTAFVRREPGEIFRLHDLFRDYLRAQREHVLDGAVVARLAELLLDRDPAEALRILVRHELRDEIAAALERTGFELIEQGAGDVVARALGTLGGRIRSPVVLALRATLDAAAGANQSAAAHYTRALREASGPDYVRIALPYALWILTRGEAAESLDILLRIAPEELTSSQIADYWGLVALAYANTGDANRANAAAARATDAITGIGDEHAAVRALFRSAYVAYMTEDHANAETLALEAVRRCREAGYASIADRAYSILSAIAQERRDYPRAMYYAEQVVYNAARAGDGPAQRNGLVTRFAIAVDMGDVAKAGRLREELRRFPVREGIGISSVETLTDAVLSLALKRYREALLTLDRPGVSFSEAERALVAAMRAVLAYLMEDEDMARKEGRMAKRWLSLRRRNDEPRHEAQMLVVTRALVIAVDVALGREGEARRALRDLAQRSDSPVVESLAHALEGTSPEPLLTEVRGDTIYAGIIEDLLAVVERRRNRSPLTRTELIVLAHLAEGESDKEIAAALGVRATTVSNHVTAITSKLQCRGRYRAVAIARDLGYLDPSPME